MKIKRIDQVYSQFKKIFDTCLGTQGEFLNYPFKFFFLIFFNFKLNFKLKFKLI